MALMEEFKYLKIQLEHIKTATDNFAENKVIGTGGFGKVYEGVVPHSKGLTLVAIKRLDRSCGQGDPEFWKEIMMLSRYRHPNLISLLGYCDEGVEKIVVYEHALNGSLDRHLSSPSLKWTQRIKICLDAARGLKYLHDHKGTQQRVIHRDIKSSNILLDEKWNAKVSDMGLSKIGPANQKHTFLFTNVVGTMGYCDPQYMKTYALTKESDIYSFGVVLLEVLCGKLCYKKSNGVEILVPMWKKSYKHKKLESIIFKDPGKMHPSALEAFADIAFLCLKRSCEKRPTISQLVEKLTTALEYQERHDLKAEYEHIMLLSNEVFLNGGQKQKRCSRAMAVGVVEASCEEIFELVMGMDATRFEWDCSFLYGSLVEEVDQHTAILYHRLQLDWFPTMVWPRDLCYVRYWRRNDDGSYVILFRSKEHENCGPQPGYVRAHIESGGFSISPLKPRNGQPITKVQHHMQIDLKGWGVGSVSSFQKHCLRQILNSVDGLQEYFAQTDQRTASLRIPVMVNMASRSVPTKKTKKNHLTSVHNRRRSLDIAANIMDEYSDEDEDEDFQIPVKDSIASSSVSAKKTQKIH